MQKSTYMQRYLAEAIGTFFFIFFGCGSIIMFQVQPEIIDPIIIPFVFGGVITLMTFAFGNISGAHFNPAISFAFTIVKKLELKAAFGYIAAQIWGGVCAIFALAQIWKYTDHDFGMTLMSVNLEASFAIEFLLASCLIFVACGVAKAGEIKGQGAAMAVGLTYTIGGLVAGPLTGASMNPLRSVMPAFAMKNFTNIDLYLGAVFLGCAVGALTFQFLNSSKSSD